jgi:hypothetical protein
MAILMSIVVLTPEFPDTFFVGDILKYQFVGLSRNKIKSGYQDDYSNIIPQPVPEKEPGDQYKVIDIKDCTANESSCIINPNEIFSCIPAFYKVKRYTG